MLHQGNTLEQQGQGWLLLAAVVLAEVTVSSSLKGALEHACDTQFRRRCPRIALGFVSGNHQTADASPGWLAFETSEHVVYD